jgi:general secretion pathway protein D
LASRTPGFRFRGVLVHAAFATALLVAGCAQQSGPALIDELRDADLSEKSPQRVRQSGGPDSKGQTKRAFETYPGDDSFGEQLAKANSSAPATTASLRRSQAQAAVFRAPVQSGGDGYQLNFDNASLAEVVKVILGDTLKLPYFYDPRVQGQITLSTGKPVSRDALLSVLESALKMNNGVLAASGNGYRITPAGEAVAGDLTSVSLNREDALAPGFGVSVLPLHNVSAEAMLTLLENFISRGGSMKAEATGNLLLIRGTAGERRSLMDVAASFDVDWLKGQSAGIFPLTHATPDELIGELQQTMHAEQGDLVAKMVRFQPIHRLNAVLVLSRQSTHLRKAAEWIRRLDRSNAAGQSLYVYRVENSKAQDLAALLNDTLGSGGGGRKSSRSEVAPGRGVQSLSAKGSQSSSNPNPLSTGGGLLQPAAPQTGQVQPAAAIRPARPAPSTTPAPGPSAAPSSGASSAPPEARIIADEVNNLLLINSSPSEYQRILTVLRKIDRPPLQVMINATIAEVTLNDTLRYGVQVFLKGKDFSGGHVNQTEIPLGPGFPGMNFILGSLTDPKLVLDALAGVTEVKVVSSPSVVVIDNQPALLKVGDEVPISTQQTSAIESVNAPIINTIRFRDTGVILKVIPRVNSSGLVTMDIEQEISAVVPQAGGPTLTPTISQRRIASTISVYSGQMVALGGLISEQRNRDKSGLPIINKVPILGEIIGTNERGTKRTELIVFIRPQVIRDPHDARAVAEELRSRLHSMSFPPPPPLRDGGWRTRSTHAR